MGLLTENISKVDALDFVITEEFLKIEGFKKNMHGSYIKSIRMKNKDGHVGYLLFFGEKRLFYNDQSLLDLYSENDYIFYAPEIYNAGLEVYVDVCRFDQFDDYNEYKYPVRTIREYFDFLEYLKEKAQLF